MTALPQPVAEAPLLRMRGIEKRFGATVALRGVELDVLPGSVHALIGENGAGKSTLMKTLSGACSPDAGTMELGGEPFFPSNPLHARALGVCMIASMSRARQQRITYEACTQNIVKAHLLQQFCGPSYMANVTTF